MCLCKEDNKKMKQLPKLSIYGKEGEYEIYIASSQYLPSLTMKEAKEIVRRALVYDNLIEQIELAAEDGNLWAEVVLRDEAMFSNYNLELLKKQL